MNRLLALALLLAPWLRLPAAEAAEATKPARPLVFAAYYCWYHDGAHPERPFLHWTYPSSETNALAKKAQKPGEPPPNSAARPLAGLYDSADPKVADWHVQLAQAAGIDAFLVDWWDTHNQLDRNVDRGIVAAIGKRGFKFALLDERAQFHDTLENYLTVTRIWWGNTAISPGSRTTPARRCSCPFIPATTTRTSGTIPT
jgi:hypothetical protein